MKKIPVSIDGKLIEMNVDGDTFWGNDETLLFQDDDLTQAASWHQMGFSVNRFLTDELFNQLKNGTTNIVRQFVEKEMGVKIPDFTLLKYHEFCKENTLHLAVVRHFQQCLPIEKLPINWKLVAERISEICGIKVSPKHPTIPGLGVFCVRIVRPQRKTDNNPPHRDVWIDRLRNGINIYLPLAGSNAHSSLPIIPASHFWNESSIKRTASGSKVNGVPFSVPCVVDSAFGLNMVRPQVKENEVMVFSPYLIHGGGCNLNWDETRFSIEIRFWRNDDADIL